MDLRKYQQRANDYEQLSLRDLLDARDLYHVHLMRHPHVVATAIGRYRIRVGDDWPTDKGFGHKGTGERTLANSEVRPYSWPSVLVFVDQWVAESEFSKDGRYDPDDYVPKTLYLPDGRRVPVCIISAPRELVTNPRAPDGIAFPTNNIGGGYPIIAGVQGREYVATIACLVSDGHKVYALTNRHVTGAAGEVLQSELNGERVVIGRTAAGSCDRLPFANVYPGWPGTNVNVNVDAGLIDIDNLDCWSAKIRKLGIMGPLADLSVDNLSLRMTGCRVVASGAASGVMRGEIAALFYRYKSVGGFDFVADFLIGPRATRCFGPDDEPEYTAAPAFVTHPGDSGTLWLLEPMSDAAEAGTELHRKPAAEEEKETPAPLLPLAMQWGAHVLDSPGAGSQTYVLATALSTICRELGVDLLRDWNLDQPDTWGAVGHFAIASRTAKTISKAFPRLQQLMENNAAVITHDDATILSSEFKHQGDAKFVALADVPDFFWKHGHQGASRQGEGPNHFADMDHRSTALKADLLTLCEKAENVDAAVWDHFYDTVTEILTGKPIEQKYRGLLPFRVWQIFDEMIDFAANNDHEKFVCAAGVLTHYVGDACQPLHISFLHDGDPRQPVSRVVHHRDERGDETVQDPLGVGVHAAYEDEMVNAHRKEILKGLDKTPKAAKDDLVANGFEAAQRTIALMRLAFTEIAPETLVNAFVQHKEKKGRADAFWKQFGTPTIKCMQAGTHLLAVLLQNAWRLGDGEKKVKSLAALTQKRAMEICRPQEFLQSYTIGEIGDHLRKPGE